MRCTTCNISIQVKDSFVRFKCPNCGETEIIRCKHCRQVSNKYTCPNPKCGFTGP